MEKGDLVTLDVTVELDGYFADAAVTVGVPPVSDLARRLMECAESAFQNAARAVRAGERLAVIGGKVEAEVERQGFTVVPLKFYFNGKGRAKLEIALARGKKLHDKRETLKQRSWDRERSRLLRAKG